jgi:hypothetical protein
VKTKSVLFLAAVLLLSFAPTAVAEDHKNEHRKDGSQRGMLEKMEAVPCGAKQRGLSGVGSVFGSAGIEHSSSTEKMCPQYLLRTDEMEYHVRPTDGKHPSVLPVGHEAEFKIKNDRMFLKIPDGDRKVRTYEVVAMKPLNSDSSAEAPDKKEIGDRKETVDRNKSDSDQVRDKPDADKDRSKSDPVKSDSDKDPNKQDPPQ